MCEKARPVIPSGGATLAAIIIASGGAELAVIIINWRRRDMTLFLVAPFLFLRGSKEV